MKNKKRVIYILFGFLITLGSWIYIFYNYNWTIFIPIFFIHWGINITKSKTFKNK